MKMYDRIFNTLAVLTVAGLGFIACTLPKVFETDADIKANDNPVTMPVLAINAPDASKAIKQKTADDAYVNIGDALALYEVATSVKEPRIFEKYQYVYVGDFYITMYAATAEQCGNDLGITASGRKVTDDPKCHTVAVDPAVIPLGSYLIIEGYDDIIFRADDTGSAINGYDIDIFTTSESESKTFNNQTGVKVWIIKEVF